MADSYDGGAPYWAYLWPGGSALIQHLAKHPDIVGDRTVLDLASGSGMVGIAAKKIGACRVVAFDTDPLAQATGRQNAALNGVTVELARDEKEIWNQKFDVILAGDVFYDADVTNFSLRVFRRSFEIGTQIMVGDIGREFLPRAHLTEIAPYKVRDVGSHAESDTEEAWVFEYHG